MIYGEIYRLVAYGYILNKGRGQCAFPLENDVQFFP